MSSTKAKEDYLSYLNNYKMGLVTWHRGRTMSLVYARCKTRSLKLLGGSISGRTLEVRILSFPQYATSFRRGRAKNRE